MAISLLRISVYGFIFSLIGVLIATIMAVVAFKLKLLTKKKMTECVKIKLYALAWVFAISLILGIVGACIY